MAGPAGRGAVLPWLALPVAVAVAYANSLHGAFQFDDFAVIVRNPAVHSWGAWLASLPGIRPLLRASYTASWTLGGGVAGFRAFNVAVHAIATLLVYGLLRTVFTPADWPATRTRIAALVGALVFALHPAQTEAVTYVSGRSMSLMAVPYLAAVLWWLRGSRGASIGVPLLLLAALAVRETAVTLPLAIMLLARARGDAWPDILRRTTPLWAILVLGFALILLVPAYREFFAVSLQTRSPLENLLAQAGGLSYLLGRVLLTLRTNIDPDLPGARSPDAFLLLESLCVLAPLVLAAAAWRRWRWASAGVLWLYLHLLPTNSLVARLDVANDRHLYVAMAGAAWLAGALVALLVERRRVAGTVATVMLVGLLTMTTALRNTDYRSEVTLWEATVEDSPRKARAWNNLGYAYVLAGRDDDARRAWRRALELDPRQVRARFNLMRMEAGLPPK